MGGVGGGAGGACLTTDDCLPRMHTSQRCLPKAVSYKDIVIHTKLKQFVSTELQGGGM